MTTYITRRRDSPVACCVMSMINEAPSPFLTVATGAGSGRAEVPETVWGRGELQAGTDGLGERSDAANAARDAHGPIITPSKRPGMPTDGSGPCRRERRRNQKRTPGRPLAQSLSDETSTPFPTVATGEGWRRRVR